MVGGVEVREILPQNMQCKWKIAGHWWCNGPPAFGLWCPTLTRQAYFLTKVIPFGGLRMLTIAIPMQACWHRFEASEPMPGEQDQLLQAHSAACSFTIRCFSDQIWRTQSISYHCQVHVSLFLKDRWDPKKSMFGVMSLWLCISTCIWVPKTGTFAMKPFFWQNKPTSEHGVDSKHPDDPSDQSCSAGPPSRWEWDMWDLGWLSLRGMAKCCILSEDLAYVALGVQKDKSLEENIMIRSWNSSCQKPWSAMVQILRSRDFDRLQWYIHIQLTSHCFWIIRSDPHCCWFISSVDGFGLRFGVNLLRNWTTSKELWQLYLFQKEKQVQFAATEYSNSMS